MQGQPLRYDASSCQPIGKEDHMPLNPPHDVMADPDTAIQFDKMMKDLKEWFKDITMPSDGIWWDDWVRHHAFLKVPDRDNIARQLWMMGYGSTEKIKPSSIHMRIPWYDEMRAGNKNFVEPYKCLLEFIKTNFRNEDSIRFYDLNMKIMDSYRLRSNRDLKHDKIPKSSFVSIYRLMASMQLAAMIEANELPIMVPEMFPAFKSSFHYIDTLLSWLDAEGEDELEMDKNGLIVLIQGWIDGMPDDFIIESVKMKIADGQS